jgi:hypothetical protein
MTLEADIRDIVFDILKERNQVFEPHSPADLANDAAISIRAAISGLSEQVSECKAAVEAVNKATPEFGEVSALRKEVQCRKQETLALKTIIGLETFPAAPITKRLKTIENELSMIGNRLTNTPTISTVQGIIAEQAEQLREDFQLHHKPLDIKDYKLPEPVPEIPEPYTVLLALAKSFASDTFKYLCAEHDMESLHERLRKAVEECEALEK